MADYGPFAPAQPDFSWLGNLPNAYAGGVDFKAQQDLKRAFSSPEVQQALRNKDYGSLAAMLGQFDPAQVATMAKLALAQSGQESANAYRQASLEPQSVREYKFARDQQNGGTPTPSGEGPSPPPQMYQGETTPVPNKPLLQAQPGATVNYGAAPSPASNGIPAGIGTTSPAPPYFPQTAQANSGVPDFTTWQQQKKFKPAQDIEDTAFAKDVPLWESSGRAETQQGLRTLEDAITKATTAKQQGVTVSGKTPGVMGTIAQNVPFGPTAGMGTIGELIKTRPDYAAANYPEAVDIVNAHVRAVAAGMKGLLGARPAESIINQIIQATYNADLPPELNIPRLQRLRDSIARAATVKDAQVAWFKQYKTLSGFQGPDPADLVSQSVQDYVGTQPSAGTYQSPPPPQQTAPAQGGVIHFQDWLNQ